jgi:hypothetical protein
MQMVEDSPICMEASVPAPPGALPADAAPGTNGASVAASTLLVPPMLKLLQSGGVNVRRQAAACLNLMAKDMPPGIQKNLDA